MQFLAEVTPHATASVSGLCPVDREAFRVGISEREENRLNECTFGQEVRISGGNTFTL